MTEKDLSGILGSYPNTFTELALNDTEEVLILCHIYANIISKIFFISL